MSSGLTLTILFSYFALLFVISLWSSRKADQNTFLTGNRKSNWLLVAYGMIGTSLSGVTFIGIPGEVQSSGLSYLLVVFGYFFGYLVIAYVLLPLFYHLKVTSIYEFLNIHFGHSGERIGGVFFVLSRIIGASLRILLVAVIFHEFIIEPLDWNISFFATTAISVGLIWVYTFRGGIKTIVLTDTLQTTFMLVSLLVSIVAIVSYLDSSFSFNFNYLIENNYLDFNKASSFLDKKHWLRALITGFFITLTMTGLDQDMMQKNLSISNIKDAQKNMLLFACILIVVNFGFLLLGAELALLRDTNEVVATEVAKHSGNDKLFASIALSGILPVTVGIFFVLGLVSAAYSSADSALTSLTTSVCIDIFRFDRNNKNFLKRQRIVHIVMSLVIILAVTFFRTVIKDQAVIWKLFDYAALTYGPLLGMFVFGIIFKHKKVSSSYLWLALLTPPLVTLLIQNWAKIYHWSYIPGGEMILFNGLFVFFLILLLPKEQVLETNHYISGTESNHEE